MEGRGRVRELLVKDGRRFFIVDRRPKRRWKIKKRRIRHRLINSRKRATLSTVCRKETGATDLFNKTSSRLRHSAASPDKANSSKKDWSKLQQARQFEGDMFCCFGRQDFSWNYLRQPVCLLLKDRVSVLHLHGWWKRIQRKRYYLLRRTPLAHGVCRYWLLARLALLGKLALKEEHSSDERPSQGSSRSRCEICWLDSGAAQHIICACKRSNTESLRRWKRLDVYLVRRQWSCGYKWNYKRCFWLILRRWQNTSRSQETLRCNLPKYCDSVFLKYVLMWLRFRHFHCSGTRLWGARSHLHSKQRSHKRDLQDSAPLAIPISQFRNRSTTVSPSALHYLGLWPHTNF